MDDRGGKTEYRLSSVVRLLRMRIQISHLTNYRYDAPAASVIHMLRLTPRNHDGQYVARWRIDVSTDCRLDQHEDAFGNITHVFTADGPLTELAVAVEGEVETRDTQGIVRGVVERFPPNFYLRETALTTPDVNIAGFAAVGYDAVSGDVLNLLHVMLARLHACVIHHSGAPTTMTAAEAFVRRRGLCRFRPHFHCCRSQPQHSRALCGWLCPPRRRHIRARQRPRLGRGVRARARLGWLRCRERGVRHGRACAGRRRTRFLGRGPATRYALRRHR